MAFTGNWTCNTFKTGLMNGTFNFTSGTYKIALYTNSATLDATTTAYTATGEASGGNYVAGGNTLTIAQTPTIGNQTGAATSYISFSNTTWTGAILARGALIYLSGSGNPAVCVLDFGSDKSSSSTFTVQFPAVTNTSAIIRIS
jgi:hypothetical protein